MPSFYNKKLNKKKPRHSSSAARDQTSAKEIVIINKDTHEQRQEI